MKYYKFTVLKDLPDFNKGEEYRHVSEKDIDEFNSIRRGGKDISKLFSIARNYPDFVKKEIDIDSAVQVDCPKCGGTKMFTHNEPSCKRDDGVIYYYRTISLTCAICGYKQNIYTFETRSEVYSW